MYKKMLLSTVTSGLILSTNMNAEMLFPNFKGLSQCVVEHIEYKTETQDKNVFKNELSPDIKVIENYFEKAISSLEKKNIVLAEHLISNRYKYKIKSKIIYLKGDYINERCSSIVNDIETKYYQYEKALMKMIEMDSKPEEDNDSSFEKESEVNHFEKVKTRKVNTSSYDDSYTKNDLYIVSAEIGVNVRNDPVLQTKAKIIDTLGKDTVLRLIKQVIIDENEVWGKFTYVKNNQKSLGWIRMDYVYKIQYAR